jgi:hypothetical protein
VHVDEVREPELTGEPVRTAERLGGEPGQVVDVRGTRSVNSVRSTGSASALS